MMRINLEEAAQRAEKRQANYLRSLETVTFKEPEFNNLYTCMINMLGLRMNKAQQKHFDEVLEMLHKKNQTLTPPWDDK